MPVIIQDLDAQVVDEPTAPTGPSPHPDAAAPAAPPSLLAWVAVRELVAEREARLAID